MSLIRHDGDSLDCGHSVSDVFDTNTGVWRHCDDDDITKISDLPEGGYTREIHKKTKKASDVRINKYIVCSLYQNKPSDSIHVFFFQEFTNMSKIHHMKKVMKYLNAFRKYFRAIQDVSDEIQTIISFIKDEIQTFIETNISCKKENKKIPWLNRGGLKKLLTVNPMENHIIERNTTSNNIPYLVYNKKCLCQHEKLHPLTARKGKWISGKKYIDIEKFIQQDSHKFITSEGRDIYQLRN